MTTQNVGARIPLRELQIIAVAAKMYDATPAELTRYAYRRFLGDTHEQAKNAALMYRKTALGNDVEDTTSDVMVTVQIPEEWIEQVREKTAELDVNKSTVHRFILAKVSEPSDERALAIATRHPGWQKGRSRKSTATA